MLEVSLVEYYLNIINILGYLELLHIFLHCSQVCVVVTRESEQLHVASLHFHSLKKRSQNVCCICYRDILQERNKLA